MKRKRIYEKHYGANLPPKKRQKLVHEAEKAALKSSLVATIKSLTLTEIYPTDPENIDASLKKAYGLLLHFSRTGIPVLGISPDHFEGVLNTSSFWPTEKGLKNIAEFHFNFQPRIEETRCLFAEIKKLGLTESATTFEKDGYRLLKNAYDFFKDLLS